ncbi:MAG: hypothetical protein JSS38_14930 [Nitrospira sp.]|nr:hypothetical protein [Nitrospira sp.]
MTFLTRRNVTLVLLFVLLANAVYAGSGDGPTPGQREQRRNNNNNGGQGRQIPQGGVQVLPGPQGRGIDLDQFNQQNNPAAERAPNANPAAGNLNRNRRVPVLPNQGGGVVPQSPNQADVDTRNNPVVPPAVPPVPNRGPVGGNPNAPAAQSNLRNQGNVRQLQQQLGLEQRLGNGRPPVLGDANQQQAAPKNLPRRLAPPVLQNRNQQDQADVDTRNNRVAEPGLNADPAAGTPNPVQQSNATPNQVSTTVFDWKKAPTITYKGDVLFLNENRKRVAYLAEDGSLNGQPVRRFLGGGANSRVHESSDSRYVKKLISLDWQGDRRKAAATITDQNFGREILTGLKLTTKSPLFRVAKLEMQEVVTASHNDKEYRFVFNREDNIASEVYRAEEGEGRDQQIFGSDKQPIEVSNAQERAEKRNPASNPPLTELEELTINLVIRHLNDNGIIWTDHKLANLDIVRNPDSPTGYQVIFFDFDGFRRVNGKPESQAAAARDIQKAFDNPALANSNTPGDRGWEMMDNRVKQAYRKHYPEECKKSEDANRGIPLDLGFDRTAFGDAPVRTLATPPANLNRTNYLYFNGLSEQAFTATVGEINIRKGLAIEFKPNNPSPIRTIQ